MSLTLISPPVSEPVSIADLKAHLRVTSSDEDSIIAGLGLAARQAIEARYGLCILAQSWRLALDQLPECAIVLPFSPIISVESVGVVSHGVTEVLPPAHYEFQAGLVGRVCLKMPSSSVAEFRTLAGRTSSLGALSINFTAGWIDVNSVPEEVKLAIKVLTAHFFENREGGVADRFYTSPESLNALLAPYKRVRI